MLITPVVSKNIRLVVQRLPKTYRTALKFLPLLKKLKKVLKKDMETTLPLGDEGRNKIVLFKTVFTL